MLLETDRLILDTWQSSDWTAFRPIANDVEVMRYITGGVPWTDEKIQAFVSSQVETYRTHGFCRWKLLDKAAGNLIGFCGANYWRDAPIPEIGWWLARSYWGRGLAMEAAMPALRDIFERVQLARIISVARPDNLGSRRIMEKLGLVFDCEFENEGIRLVRYSLDRLQYENRASTIPGQNA